MLTFQCDLHDNQSYGVLSSEEWQTVRPPREHVRGIADILGG